MAASSPQKLKKLFGAIAQTKSEEALRASFIDTIGSHFQSQRWGLYLYNLQGKLSSVDIHGIRNVDAFVERYQSVGKTVDPVLKHVETYHTPAHEGLFYKADEWKASPLYTRCCASMDHAHFMTGPIVGNGQMTGAAYFSRLSGTPAFTAQSLAELGAVCAHISAKLATFQQAHVMVSPAVQQRLTARELQIAELVATGLTNKAISQQLWITENTVKQALKKIFRKLNVNNRTALVAKLFSDG